MPEQPPQVLFLCTGNSARSQMAEAILRELSHGQIAVESAGSAPRQEIHPMARAAVRTLLGIDMTGQHPKSLDRFLGRHSDYVCAVCDDVADRCPVLPGALERAHWSVRDPAAATGTDADKQQAFDTVAGQLVARIRLWLPLLTRDPN